MSNRLFRFRYDRKAWRSLSIGPILTVLAVIGLVIGGLLGYGYLDRHDKLPEWLGGSEEKAISYEKLGPQSTVTPVTPGTPAQTGEPSEITQHQIAGISTVELEQQIHNLINAEREKQGLSLLAWDEALAAVARKHSQDMADRAYFSHISPEGEGPLERCKEEEYDPRKIATGDYQYRLGCAENLFQGSVEKRQWYSGGTYTHSDYYTLAELAAQAVEGWMDSPGHRENILTAYWLTEGIGIVIAPDGKVYATQNFN